MSPSQTAWVTLVSFAMVACGGGSPPPSSTPPPSSSARTVSSAEPPAPVPPRPGGLSRSEAVAALSRGFGAFLARVQVEPALSNGKFRGWRVVKLSSDPMWRGVDLAPGDVVTQVNGLPIEHPEQALSAFQSLAVAKELRVSLERNGARREIVYPIDD